MLKKFTKELAQKIRKELVQHKKLIEKANSDNGTFKVIMTTEAMDRHGEIVSADGMQKERFMQNPVVLFGHKHDALPIGKVLKIYQEDGKTYAEGVFVSAEANPVAQNVRKLYDAKVLRAVSIGFIAKDWDGNTITEWELLELSFVPIPSNYQALDVKMKKELKSVFNYSEKCGLKLCDKALKAKKKVFKVNKELKAIKELTAVIKQLVEVDKDVLNRVSKVENKIKKISAKAPKKAKGDEDKLLLDVNQSTQLISKIADNINKKFNDIR